MVTGIEFTDKRFETKENNNVIEFYTNNCIILCCDLNIMNSLAEEIFNTINGKAEYNNYCCDDNDIGKAKYEMNFGLQKIIDVNGQKITLALEPSIVYKAKDIRDIWFAEWFGSKDDKGFSPYKESVYPMLIFKGSRDVWNEGLDAVYRMIVNGRYGTYDGSWTNLN